MLAFTADNHLGVEAQWSLKERKNDFLKAFHNVCLSVEEKQASSLIIGGDLFDTAHPPSFAVEFVQSEIRALEAKGIRTYGIDGNHDIADNKWLKVCGITPLSDEPVIVDGKAVCGISYRRSTEVIATLNAMADRGVKCDIIVLHLAFGELNRMGAASDLTANDILPALKAMGTRLVLMGHIHIAQDVTVDDVTFAYCGSSEICSMNEPKKKGITLVDDRLNLLPCPIETREVENTVIGNEKEFAAYEASIAEGSPRLQAVFVGPEVKDGVRRLRDLAKAKRLLMRIQVLTVRTAGEESEIDRTVGVIGLEQAIGLSFRENSEEATLVRAILRSPETLKMTVEKYMKGETK